jgi:hypothetical protein
VGISADTKMVKRKGVYLATLVVVLAIVAGYAAASIVLNSSTQHASGNYISGASSVTGLTYTATVLGVTSDPPPAASSGTGTAPQALVAGPNAFCGSSSCVGGDFSQQVTYTFTTSMAGAVFITVQVAANSGAGTVTLYLGQASTAVAGSIVIYWDLGTSNTLTAVTTTAQQCSTPTACP